MFCRSLFVFFLLAIVLFVLLLYKDSDYPFGIFKLFSQQMRRHTKKCPPDRDISQVGPNNTYSVHIYIRV
jgi:hypothetical protein